MHLNNMIRTFVFPLVVIASTLATLLVVSVIDNSGELHTLYFVGDLDLVISSLVISFCFIWSVMKITTSKVHSGSSNVLGIHFGECFGVYLLLLLLVMYLYTSGAFESRGIENAIAVLIVTNCITVAIAHVSITKIRSLQTTR